MTPWPKKPGYKPRELEERLKRFLNELAAAKNNGEPVSIGALFLKHLPGVPKDRDLEIPLKSRVSLIELRHHGKLLAALIHLFDEDYQKCEEQELGYGAGTVTAVLGLVPWQDPDGRPRLRLSKLKGYEDRGTQLFAVSKPWITVPSIGKPGILHVNYRIPEDICGSNVYALDGIMTEIFFLADGRLTPLSLPIKRDMSNSIPGRDTSLEANVRWVLGKRKKRAFLLSLARKTVTIHPCTGDLSKKELASKACQPKVRCSRTISLHATVVAPQKGSTWTAKRLASWRLARLRKREPALAALPRKTHTRGDKACAALLKFRGVLRPSAATSRPTSRPTGVASSQPTSRPTAAADSQPTSRPAGVTTRQNRKGPAPGH
jgi:hypothetical protein